MTEDPHATTQDRDAAAPRCDRRWRPLEFIALMGLLLIGSWLRVGHCEKIAVEHFDEGVYASDALFPGGYPFRHLYAPPLMPLAIQWASRFGSAESFGPSLPNLAASCLTLAVVWWVARRWFGVCGAMAALAVATFSQLHSAYSRTALTDAMLLLWLMSSLYFVERLLRRSDVWSIAGLGMTTALAWWTKYNGWLPLAIAAGSIVMLAVLPGTRSGTLRRCLAGVASALCALILWTPVWWNLPGGYAEVSANHQKYLVGLSGWLRSLQTQIAHLWLFDGVVPIVCALVGGLAPGVVLWRIRQSGVVAQIAPLAVTLTGFWGLAISTPAYTPYARLLLPWNAMAWIAFGCFFGSTSCRRDDGFLPALRARGLRSRESARKGTSFMQAVTGMQGVIMAIAVVGGCVHSVSNGWIPWEDRRSLSQAAEQMVEDHRLPAGERDEGRETIFAIYGEPALLYQLIARDATVAPLGGQDPMRNRALSRPETKLVVGPHARQDRAFLALWEREADRFGTPRRYRVPRSLVARLDQDVSPSTRSERSQPDAYDLYSTTVSRRAKR